MIVAVNGRTPTIAKTAFIHPLAFIAGDVVIDEYASIWPFVSIRGERERIHIGAYTNVQDNSCLHADPGEPMEIAPYVTIGHSVTLHCRSIGEHTLVGMSATLVQRVRIGAWCLVGAGAVCADGFEAPDRSIVLGLPARVAGPVLERHQARLERSGKSYIEMGQRYISEGLGETFVPRP